MTVCVRVVVLACHGWVPATMPADESPVRGCVRRPHQHHFLVFMHAHHGSLDTGLNLCVKLCGSCMGDFGGHVLQAEMLVVKIHG